MIKLYGGDCLEVLKSFPANHFDTIVTDPPYQLGFMGKHWDQAIPGVPFWREFLRVCKPGAFALVFGGTRTFHRLTCAMEDAGWEIRDCMMWLYGSGFPKSLDISKAIDKAKGQHKSELVATKQGNRKLEKGEQSNTFSTDTHAGYRDISKPQTDLAKLWDGWGTALKPAWEPIVVAMKPLDGTFAHNAEKWGVGGLWIDGGRIGTGGQWKWNKPRGHGFEGYNDAGNGTSYSSNSQGRWPANLILDEEAAAMLDEQSGISKSTKSERGKVEIFKKENSWIGESTERGHNDSGGASRYFYCAKASKSERNAGLENMPSKPRGPIGEGLDNTLKGPTNALRKDLPTLSQNNHPTVKPLALMEYLCKLTKTPTGGVVLDPFAGSGTTGLACMNMGRDCVLIEKESEYCEIIRGRIKGNAAKKN